MTPSSPLITLIKTALEDVKAKDLECWSTAHLPSLFDTLFIATGDSSRQCKALAQRVASYLREQHYPILGIEGLANGEWVLVDCGSVLVHIMQPAQRAYYNLTELWANP